MTLLGLGFRHGYAKTSEKITNDNDMITFFNVIKIIYDKPS